MQDFLPANGSLCFHKLRAEMSDYNWCHGPKCHKHKTQDRIRGVKGSKVLRTRKIPQNQWNANNMWSHFCSQWCYDNFTNKHLQQVIAIAPRTECLETPIHDPVKTRHSNSWHTWYNTEIKEVDNNSNP